MTGKNIHQDYAKFRSPRLVDFFGSKITVGSKLLKPGIYMDSPCLEKRTVTAIKKGKMYLDNSPVATKYPGRCLLVESFKRGKNV